MQVIYVHNKFLSIDNNNYYIYTLHILIKNKLWKISLLFEPPLLHALQEGLVSVEEEI